MSSPRTITAGLSSTTGVPSSSARGLIVRDVSSGGAASSTQVTVSTGRLQVLQSTAADLQMTATPAAGSTWTVRALQSTAADLNAAVVQGSTVWVTQVSSVAGQVSVGEYSTTAPGTGSTGLVVRQVGYSTIVAVSSVSGRVLADQNSTVWQTQAKIQDSSAVGFVGTTTRPSTGAQGLVVRSVLNDLRSTAFSTLGNTSTSSTIVSSVAGLRQKVYAYSITSTVQAVNTLTFASSLANVIWTLQLQAFSSGIAGANLAVSPPAWLFATEASSPLVFKVTGTTGTYHVAFSYFSEA